MRVPSSRASATAARWRERFSRSPKRSARRSTTIAPALWRELAYRSSGLPSPRISQGPVSRRDAPASSPPVAGSAAFVPERRQRSSRDRCDYASSPPSEASAAPSSSASTGSTVAATTETTDDSGASRIVAPDGALRSPTRRTSPICRPDTSPSIASGTAVTSASTLSWCRSWSRMPPWTTPGASPTRWTGTDTVTFSPRRTTRKSTWVKVPRTGCRWTSRASARWRTLPSWSSSRALAPPLRIAWPNARASIDRCSGLMPWPYRTAGTRPAARTRRAAPFPVSVRDSAASWYSDMGNEPPCRVRRFSSEAGTATRNGPAAGGGAAQGSSAARTGSSRAPGAAAGCRDRSGRRAGRHASAAARAGLGLLDPGRGLGAGRGVHGAAHPVGGRHARPHVRALHAPRGAGVVLAEEGQERADRLLVLGVQPTLGGHLLQALPELTGAPDDGSGRVDHNDQVLAGGEQAPEARSRPHRVRRLGERLVAGGHRPSPLEPERVTLIFGHHLARLPWGPGGKPAGRLGPGDQWLRWRRWRGSRPGRRPPGARSAGSCRRPGRGRGASAGNGRYAGNAGPPCGRRRPRRPARGGAAPRRGPCHRSSGTTRRGRVRRSRCPSTGGGRPRGAGRARSRRAAPGGAPD